jgi:ECF transporter S component (folate family)
MRRSFQLGQNRDLEKLIFAALLTSIAIVIKVIFNYIPLPTQIKNIDLFLIFIILGGVLMGPLYGGLIGFTTDIVYIFIAGGDWGLFTVAHTVAGLVPGLMFFFLKYNKINLTVSMFITILLYFGITTYALKFYGYVPIINYITIMPRVIRTLVTFIPYILIVHFLVTDSRLQNSSIYKDFRIRHMNEDTITDKVF